MLNYFISLLGGLWALILPLLWVRPPEDIELEETPKGVEPDGRFGGDEGGEGPAGEAATTDETAETMKENDDDRADKKKALIDELISFCY